MIKGIPFDPNDADSSDQDADHDGRQYCEDHSFYVRTTRDSGHLVSRLKKSSAPCYEREQSSEKDGHSSLFVESSDNAQDKSALDENYVDPLIF